MLNYRTLLYLCVAVVFALLASCGGGGGNRTLQPIVQPPASGSGQPGSDDGATAMVSPDCYLGSPRVEVDPEHVLVKTGDSIEEFAPVAAKFGYEVEWKNCNYLRLRIPDRDLDRALVELSKEYTVLDVQPIQVYVMPREVHPQEPQVKVASYMPFDSIYADRYIRPTGYDAENDQVLYSQYWGQRVYMAPMGFEGAWDVAWRDGVRSTPVTVAIIDAGIWHDEDTNPNGHPDFYYLPADPDNDRVAAGSGSVAADGTFVEGDFYYEEDGEGNPYRTVGHKLTGLFASVVNYAVHYTTQVGDPPVTAHFNGSMTPLTPHAQVMIIKTGHLSGEAWAFSDDELIASINHAVANGANVILLGMWAEGVVPLPLQTAITDARNADVLVVAPAGMSQLDTTAEDPTQWTWGPAGVVNGVTPAAAEGVLSVMGTGFEALDQDEPEDFEGQYVSHANAIIPNIGDAWNEIAEFSYTGGDIAACGWGLTWSGNFYNIGINVYTGVDGPGNVDIAYAAAYVAAAASICFQAIVNANGGVPPADVDTLIEDLLLNEAYVLPGGERFLSAANSAMVANNGGWDRIIEAVDITDYNLSGAVFNSFGNAFLEVGQETQLEASMTSSAGGFEIVVIWGDGTVYPETFPDDGEYAPYTPGTPLAHTYTEAGSYEMTIAARDAEDTYDEVSFWVFVYNPFSANLQVKNAQGGTGTDLLVSEVYNMISNASYEPVTGNTVTLDWDFNYDGAPAHFEVDVADSENPLFCYDAEPPGYSGPVNYLDLGPGDYTIGLRVTQTRRPTQYYEIDVSVTLES